MKNDKNLSTFVVSGIELARAPPSDQFLHSVPIEIKREQRRGLNNQNIYDQNILWYLPVEVID